MKSQVGRGVGQEVEQVPQLLLEARVGEGKRQFLQRGHSRQGTQKHVEVEDLVVV